MKMSSLRQTAAAYSIKFHKQINTSPKRLGFPSYFNGIKIFLSSAIEVKNGNAVKGIKRVGVSIKDEKEYYYYNYNYSSTQNSEAAGGGLEATLNNLSKWIVSATFISILIMRHDTEASWAFAGGLVNQMLSIILKRIINQERPIPALRADPGMPSSHAQTISYTIVFLAWSLAKLYGVNGFTATVGGLYFILGSYFSWLRISQKFHTASQVSVGAVIGSIFSISWCWLWNIYVSEIVESSSWASPAILFGAVALSFVGFSVVMKARKSCKSQHA